MFSVAGGLPTLVTSWSSASEDLSLNWETKQRSTYIHAQNLMQIQFQVQKYYNKINKSTIQISVRNQPNNYNNGWENKSILKKPSLETETEKC